MYGTRDAAQNWERECASKLVSWGFSKGKASPCVYYNAQKQLQVYIHGDDFVCVGNEKNVTWLKNQLTSAYEIKFHIMSNNANFVKQAKILNRIVTWTDNAIEYEADPRHAEIIMQYAPDNRQTVITGCKVTDDQRQNSRELTYEEGTLYRAATARCNFLAIDRPDIQFASKEASKYMSCPREIDWQNIYRISRYLKSHPRLKHVYYANRDIRFVDVFVDSDWAGDNITRKSTTGAVIKLGGFTVKTYSRNQK